MVETQLLADAGVGLNAEAQTDPLEATAALFATIIDTGLTTVEAGRRLGLRKTGSDR